MRMLTMLLVLSTAEAADWPQFLGPERTGISTESGIAKGWKKGPRELWRKQVGTGYSSMAVANGVVYTLGIGDDAEILMAIDAATGTERWRHVLGPIYKDSMGYHGPRATPTVTADRVIAMSGRGVLAAVSLAGERLWSVDLDEDLKGDRPKWGFSGSPLVSGGNVYIAPGGREHGLVALSAASGEPVWSRGGFSPGYSSPIRAELAGKDTIVFFTGKSLVGVAPDDGTVHWTYPWATNMQINAATPVVIGSNRLFLASAYGVGGATVLVQDDGQVSELWFSKKMKNKMATSVLVDGHLYGFNESRLSCLDATTGEEKWSEIGYGRGTLIAADDHLIVLGEDCKLSVIEASPKGAKLVGESVEYLSAEACWTVPAIADGVVYVRDTKELVAVEITPVGPTR